jgi:mannose-1-phosphate guanylyltransferase/mannose-6-phosphate isomerase
MAIVQPVIMAGGMGTRLWPLSRAEKPKQFLPLVTDRPMIADVAALVASRTDVLPPIITTSEEHAELARTIFADARLRFELIVLEPVGRSTALVAAIATLLAAKRAPDAIVVLLAADSVFSEGAEFNQTLDRAVAIAGGGRLVLLGVKPANASTHYGYIEYGSQLGDGAFQVSAFKEKPDVETAAHYLADDRHLWNSGNFVFRADVMLRELAQYAPDILAASKAAIAGAKEDGVFLLLDAKAMESCRTISIDHAVMEKTRHAAVVRLDSAWADIGSWSALWAMCKKSAKGEDLPSSISAFARKTHTLAGGELGGKKVARPWGTYEVLLRGDGYQVKRIDVAPAQAISLQYHHKRAEQWIVIRGNPRITVGKDARNYGIDETVFIEVGAQHRIENPTPDPVTILEVQIGDYLGEDDIVRLEDRYNQI